MDELIGICTANSRTTDNRVIGRRHLPLSLLDTSIQLYPSVHLRVRCKAERTFFAEEDNSYTDCQEQGPFCPQMVAARYFMLNRTIRTCYKLPKIMSDVDVMAASFSATKMHLTGSDENCCHCASHRKVIPSYLPSILTFSSSWMWRPHVLRIYNTLLPWFCLFSASCSYPYAQFLMACFQWTFRRSTTCCISHIYCRSSVCDSCNSNSGSMSHECKPFVGCHSSVGYQCETETSGGNSSCVNDFSGAPQSDYNVCGAIADCEEEVTAQHGNADINVSSHENGKILPPKCHTTVPNHIFTASLTVDDADNSDDDDDNGATWRANSTGITPVLATSSSTDNHTRWSFFIRASSSEASDCLDSDEEDDDDIDTDADSDESDNCWDDDDTNDDSALTTCTSNAQCFLIDLDPLQITGLYIPPTSNVPVSQAQCWALPLDSAAEVESESERTLKCINDTWLQCYNEDVRTKSSSWQHNTKHVC